MEPFLPDDEAWLNRLEIEHANRPSDARRIPGAIACP